MAFPSVSGTATTVTGGQATSFNINLPSSISSGDLLIMYTRISNGSDLTLPSGWSFLVQNVQSVDDDKSAIIYKTATGSEGSTINVGYSVDPINSNGMCAIVDRISGWSGTPSVSTTAQGVSGTVDANSLTPAGGAKDRLWIQAITTDGSCTLSDTTPDTTDGDSFTGFARASNDINASDKVTVMRVYLQKMDDSVDPAAAALDTGRRWDAWTIGVDGSIPIYNQVYVPTRVGPR